VFSSETIEQLFARFLAEGDEGALEQLLRRCSPALRRLARRHGARGDDADDLVQETLVAAIQRADRYDPTRPLLPWLKGILALKAARLARDELRRRRLYESMRGAEDGAGTTVDVVAGRELDGDLDAAIAALPARYREPLRQHLLGGQSPVDIAQALGMERATVRVWLHRGLANLRAHLGRWVTVLLALLLPRRAAAAGRVGAVVSIAGTVLGIVLAGIGFGAWWWLESVDDAPAGGAVPIVASPALDDVRDGALPAPRRAIAAAEVVRWRVRDARGAGLSAVGVVFGPACSRDPVLHRLSVVTDADGFVDCDLAAWSGLAVRLDTDRGVGVELPAERARRGGELVVPDGVDVVGRVVDARGLPVADAQVWLSSNADGPWRGTDVTRSGADGAFALGEVPVGAFVAARHPRLARSDVVRVGADGASLELRLGEAGGAVGVRVVDAQGAPVVGARVFVGEAMDAAPLWLAQGAASWRPPPFELRSGVDGCVRGGALEMGRHPVFVRAAGFAPAVGVADVRDGDVQVEVGLVASGRIEGRVVDGGGRGVAATVVLRSAVPHAAIDAQADGDGRFVFECVPRGVQQVAARAEGFVPGVVDVEVRDAVAPVVLALSGARRLSGCVLDAAGVGVAGARAKLTWAGASALAVPEMPAQCAADGSFLMWGMRSGQPSLDVQLPGEPLWRRVDRWATWAGDDVRVQLPADCAARSWLSGVWRDAAQRPLAAARVFVCRDGVQWAEIGRTDADGRFRVGPLPAAVYDVFAETTRVDVPTVHVRGVTLGAGEERVVEYEAPASGLLDLEVTRADGGPVGDLTITLVAEGVHRRCAVWSVARVRQVLLPGEYRVYVMGGRVRWVDGAKVKVVGGVETRLALALQPAARQSLWLRGLPAGVLGAGLVVSVRRIANGEEIGVYTLGAQAPDRLAAVLAVGEYELVAEDDAGARWGGMFVVKSAEPAWEAVEVWLARR
jgi:RNA polymerase sigma-70 factor (ECF subfamily)